MTYWGLVTSTTLPKCKSSKTDSTTNYEWFKADLLFVKTFAGIACSNGNRMVTLAKH